MSLVKKFDEFGFGVTLFHIVLGLLLLFSSVVTFGVFNKHYLFTDNTLKDLFIVDVAIESSLHKTFYMNGFVFFVWHCINFILLIYYLVYLYRRL